MKSAMLRMFLADTHHLAQEKPPGEGYQGCAEVGGQEGNSGGGGLADEAVKGPGCVMNRHGKRVDPGIGYDASAGIPSPVRDIGHPEQQADVQQDCKRNELDRDHSLLFLFVSISFHYTL